MKTDENPVVATLQAVVSVSLTQDQIQEGRRTLNLHWCGKETCNVEGPKGIVEDPSIPWTEEMREGLLTAHQALHRSHPLQLQVNLRADGSKDISIIPPKKRRKKV